jgi:hemerythrin
MGVFDMEEIDQQHRELVKIYDRLNDAVKNHEPRKDIFRIIDDAISFTELHFATEERLMVKSGYPLIEEHKKSHQELIKDARRLKDKLEDMGENMFRESFNHWSFGNVLAHIQYGDKQIEDHIIQSGLKE